MKFLVDGVDLERKTVKGFHVEAPTVKVLHSNPEEHGLFLITRVQEVRENTKRRVGRNNKRSSYEST